MKLNANSPSILYVFSGTLLNKKTETDSSDEVPGKCSRSETNSIIGGKWDAQQIHKKLQPINTISIIKAILSKDSNLEQSRFKASFYLKQGFKFELSILITSAIGIRFQSQPHF